MKQPELMYKHATCYDLYFVRFTHENLKLTLLDAAKAGMRLAKQKLRDYLPEAPTEVQDDILSHWEQHLDQLINTLTLEQLEKV